MLSLGIVLQFLLQNKERHRAAKQNAEKQREGTIKKVSCNLIRRCLQAISLTTILIDLKIVWQTHWGIRAIGTRTKKIRVYITTNVCV